jgi:hypothetical protein
MKGYTLSRKIAKLGKFYRFLRDKRQADRVKAVIALSKGWSAAKVAGLLLFDEKTSRHYFERYREGLRGEISISELCRKEGIAASVYYKWSKDFLEAGKNGLTRSTVRDATSDEVYHLKGENAEWLSAEVRRKLQ